MNSSLDTHDDACQGRICLAVQYKDCVFIRKFRITGKKLRIYQQLKDRRNQYNHAGLRLEWIHFILNNRRHIICRRIWWKLRCTGHVLKIRKVATLIDLSCIKHRWDSLRMIGDGIWNDSGRATYIWHHRRQCWCSKATPWCVYDIKL